MKTQMKFQKALTLVTLIIGALVFVFALSFFSGNLGKLLFYKNANIKSNTYAKDFTGADDFIYAGQSFNGIMVGFGIAYIVIAAFLYITATNSRRKYYVTNYVAIGLIVAIAAIVAVFCIIYISILIGEFANVDWAKIEDIRTAQRNGVPRVPNAPEVSQSHTMFVIGYAVAVVTLVNAVVWVLNLVWKIKLMKGEKALLAGGLVKEVA